MLGVLDVQSDRPGDLHDIDLLVLRTLAENISVAVEHAQMVQRLQRRADQASVIARVNQAAATILDEDLLLDQVVEHGDTLHELCDARGLGVDHPQHALARLEGHMRLELRGVGNLGSVLTVRPQALSGYGYAYNPVHHMTHGHSYSDGMAYQVRPF